MLIAIGVNNTAVALLLIKFVIIATVINKIDRIEVISRPDVVSIMVSDINIAPPVSCNAIDSMMVDATRRYILRSSADIASLTLTTLKISIRVAPITAAAAILNSPVEAKKIVKRNISLALTARCFDGRYIADHSIGNISLIPLSDLSASSDPLKRKLSPALSFKFCNDSRSALLFLCIPITLQFESFSKFV